MMGAYWCKKCGLSAMLIVFSATTAASSTFAQAGRPVANAGLPRYAGSEPVVLDGSGSYRTNGVGKLNYRWRQIAGPTVDVRAADTATPTVGGFAQTDGEQVCTFELVVNDGKSDSEPDTVDVIVVPTFNDSVMRYESGAFDAGKPTIIYFGGGNCVTSHNGTEAWNGGKAWHERANVISFHFYEPDGEYTLDDELDLQGRAREARTYYGCADMIIVYLSRVAPNYDQRIQTAGFSTGGQPAIDVANRLNVHYNDPRYTVEHVTFFDVYCRKYAESIDTFLASGAEEGDLRFVDNYVSTSWDRADRYYKNALNVRLSGELEGDHDAGPVWYVNSLTGDDMTKFNGGVIAGAFWSVVGPGRNIELGTPSDNPTYFFEWTGSRTAGSFDFLDRKNHPGALPEPVTLIEPRADGSLADGLLLTCKESRNAVAYELLVGPTPTEVNRVVLSTTSPPRARVRGLPADARFWTVRVRDKFGSTIYADPIPVPPG